jgi:Glyoxalase-like domain
MLLPISRRDFVLFSGAAALLPMMPSFLNAADASVPASLDHILLGCSDLKTGIAFVEEKTGVQAAPGGVHPGRGTQNALLSLGEMRYLEIIALDPAQPNSKNPMALKVKGLTEPHLVGWAAHPGDLVAYAKKLRQAGIAFTGPTPGSRKRPDGKLLQWQTLDLKDDASGLLPFFIEWAAGTPHPSADAPKGCSLTSFAAQTPDPGWVKEILMKLGLDLTMTSNDSTGLVATITGPKGAAQFTS